MKGIKVDIKTGKIEKVEDNTLLPERPPIKGSKGIDLEKSKEVLVRKGIIRDKSEVE